MYNKFTFSLALLLSLFLVVPTGFAETSTRIGSSIGLGPFQPSQKLEGRVEFWKLVFTKYGKSHAVLHHRLHPHIIYSVLDFSDYIKKYEGRDKELSKKKKAILKKERARIKSILSRVESGKIRTEEEKRLYTLFKDLPGSINTNLKKAKSEKLIRSQTGIKERFRGGLERSGRYLYAIERIFRDQGLPLQLARLPLVESSFDYEAKSSVGAAGIWQLMPATGRIYMRVNSGLDERRDPIVATRGAVQYLKNAYSKLDSWPIALTSYNHGINGMLRAVKQTSSKDLGVIIEKYKSRTFGFASSNFYPSFLAALEVERNAKRYFPDLVREEPLYFDEVKLNEAKSYKSLKRVADFPEDEFKNLNRSFLKSVYQGRRNVPAGYIVKVPVGKGRKYAQALGGAKHISIHEGTQVALAYKSSPKSSRSSGLASSGTTHKVRRGQTVGSIARRYRVRQRDLMRLNRIKNANRLLVGQRLKIPAGGRAPVQVARASKTYTVRRGDTLGRIARKHKVGLSKLRRLNPGVKNKILPGQKLKVN